MIKWERVSIKSIDKSQYKGSLLNKNAILGIGHQAQN